MIDLIGTPRYPLGHPNLKKVLGPGEGKPVEDEGFAALIRTMHSRVPFKNGTCYSNVRRIIEDGKGNGWRNLVPYGGWVLLEANRPGELIPCHHAWVMMGGSVIDVSTIRQGGVIQREILSRWLPKMPPGGPPRVKWEIDIRKEMIAATRPLYAGDIVENRVWGVVPQGSTYVGCPCDPLASASIFRSWHARYGKEEGYAGPGEKSLTQKMEDAMEAGEAR